MHAQRRNISGYTIMELLIVVGAIAVLSTIVVMRFAQGDQHAALQNAAAGVRRDIRQVFADARSGKLLTNAANASGFGIVLVTTSPAQYVLYANPAESTTLQYREGESILLATRDFETTESLPNIIIAECQPTPCDLFMPTEDNILFINGGLAATEIRVMLRHTNTHATTTLVINRETGQISEE